MASELDPALIEAVAKAILVDDYTDGFSPEWDSLGESTADLYRGCAVAAIRAVDAYRAASVRAHVADLIDAATASGMGIGAPELSGIEAALLALVGAEETE